MLTTRPPLDDRHEGNRSQVDRSYTPFEERLFAVLRGYFAWCSRLQVRVADDVARQSELIGGYKSVEFGDGRLASVKRIQAIDQKKWTRCSDKHLTIAYRLYIPHVWPEGPGLLAFGMGGVQTLAWTYRLGRDFIGLVLKPSLTVARISQTATPENPVTLDVFDDWSIHTS